MDAGANVHALTLESEAHQIEKRLREIRGVQNALVVRPDSAANIAEGGK